MSDPFRVLGLPADASVAEIRVARRRLAVAAHPDRGGSEEAMKALNVAFEAAVAHATGRRPLTPRPTRPSPSPRPGGRRAPQPGVRLDHDAPSFTVDALPAVAFEALLVVTSWIGEVLVDEPPYVLEVFLREPTPCWCRLELVPDAGGSTVSLVVAGVDGESPPPVEEVRDVWVAHLNQLGRWDPD